MTRGLQTLFYKRQLMNPFRYGLFAWMLISHKLVRWLVPWAVLSGLAGVALLSPSHLWARAALAGAGAACALGAIGWSAASKGRLPRWIAIPTYVCLGLVAGIAAWLKALSGEVNAVWEPTRRDHVAKSESEIT